LIVNDELRELIATKAPTSQLRAVAEKLGMVPLRKCALQWVASGETTLPEVVRVVG
jgi:general secretion pathway protein E